MKKNVRKSL
jgi:hypothetical protein